MALARPQPRRAGRTGTATHVEAGTSMIMDRAYEGGKTRQLVLELGFTPVVPPKQSRVNPWRRPSHVSPSQRERLFRRLKGFRRIDKLDVMFTAFIHFALHAGPSWSTLVTARRLS